MTTRGTKLLVTTGFVVMMFLDITHAFPVSPHARTHKSVLTTRSSSSSSSTSSTVLFNESPEQILRERLEWRDTAAVADEKQYAVPDGSSLETLNEAAATAALAAATTVAPKGTLEYDLQRIAKPRAYPLFLLEKGIEVLEDAIDEVAHMASHMGVDVSTDSSSASTSATKLEGQIQMNSTKERIVILGTGWGGASFLKAIDADRYDVTVISPRNHFVFTPMLAGASVGTVEYRSICEPIREMNRRAQYLEAKAVQIDPDAQTIACESVVCEGNNCRLQEFTVSYDRLIMTVGAQTNTFGIPGVLERCNFLKTVEDARRIKSAIVNCFERASLPGLTEEQRIRDLTFAVIGAGPTGIEYAAELRDFVEQDGPKYYPELLKFVRIKVIEASNTVLAPFDKSLQQEAVRQMQRKVDIADPNVRDLLPEQFELVELLLESSVKEVGEDAIYLNNGQNIPYGLVVWAAGNGPVPLTLDLIKQLGPDQAAQQDVARGRLAIDPWMRVISKKHLGTIFSLGDCSCIINPSQQQQRPLPATAQVASQQGEYLAKLFNKDYDFKPASVNGASVSSAADDTSLVPPPRKVDTTRATLSDAIAGFATAHPEYAKPFQFLNLGILAYTGGSTALAQVNAAPNTPPVKSKGKLGNAVWRSVYWSKQVSWRNRLLVLNDWTNRRLFGRDITRV